MLTLNVVLSLGLYVPKVSLHFTFVGYFEFKQFDNFPCLKLVNSELPVQLYQQATCSSVKPLHLHPGNLSLQTVGTRQWHSATFPQTERGHTKLTIQEKRCNLCRPCLRDCFGIVEISCISAHFCRETCQGRRKLGKKRLFF